MPNNKLNFVRAETVWETVYEELRNVFSLAITIVTSARNREEAEALLRHIGLPLQKEEEAK